MPSFDDQVDAAFSEEETAEKQPSISDDVDLHADMAALGDGDVPVDSLPAASAQAAVVSVNPSRRSVPGQAKSLSLIHI